MTEIELLQQILTVLQHIESMFELMLWLGGCIVGMFYIRIVTLRSVI